MSSIGPALPPPPSIPSLAPLGRPTVGLESAEAKNQTLPPVEESTRSDQNRDRADARADELPTDPERRGSQRAPARLADGERTQARELAAGDRSVRAHEAAQAAVGGSLAGGPGFRFVAGPGGQRYTVGGEVPISLDVVPDDPAAPLDNARQVQAAALAPAQPSPQDLQVAAAAGRLIVESQLQLATQRKTGAGEVEPGETAVERPHGKRGADTFRRVQHEPEPGTLFDQRV